MNIRYNIGLIIKHVLRSGGASIALLFCMAGISACSPSTESRIEQEVLAFSNTYFNWQFHRSVSHCTPESRKWLSYMASQVNRSDIDMLKAQPKDAVCQVEDIIYADNDSAALVEVTVSHFLQMDTIGRQGRMVDRARFRIPVMLHADGWKVNLTAPLRAEKE